MVELSSTQIGKQNPEIISKTEEFEFSSKFAWKLKFFKNRGSFELKLSFWAAKNSIMGIKVCNLYVKTLSSPILVSLETSQPNET